MLRSGQVKDKKKSKETLEGRYRISYTGVPSRARFLRPVSAQHFNFPLLSLFFDCFLAANKRQPLPGIHLQGRSHKATTASPRFRHQSVCLRST